MNVVEQILSDDLAHCIDRLATSIPEGTIERIRAVTPILAARLDRVEADLATTRAELIGGYGRWLRQLDDLENVWALAAWRAAAEESVTRLAQVAA
jgi:hypothetical protein